jgi:leucyl/phenylalanyl-tRNA--protein transferase
LKLAWLESDTPFPPVEQALAEPEGLLAAGADLSIARLTLAYSNGIFPWYAPGEPILWWSPNPRMVLACENFAPSHSLRKRLRQIARDETDAQPRIEVRTDTAVERVLNACAAQRPGPPGTWITPEMRSAYLAWHHAGCVHSIETWINGELAGGLYGVSLGRMFFGESMFSLATDASKIALAYLIVFLRRFDVAWVDCQQQTSHLASLGAAPVSRADFVRHVHHAVRQANVGWRSGRLDSRGEYIETATPCAAISNGVVRR